MSKEVVEKVENEEVEKNKKEHIYEGYSMGELLGQEVVAKIKESL